MAEGFAQQIKTLIQAPLPLKSSVAGADEIANLRIDRLEQVIDRMATEIEDLSIRLPKN